MFLDISIVLVTSTLVVVCLLIILLVLMQRPKQEGLGAAFGAGVTDQIWGSQTTNVLQKGTTYLGVLLFVLSLALAMMKSAKNNRNTGLNLADEQPATPAAPVSPVTLGTPASATSPAVSIPAPGTITPTPDSTPLVVPTETPPAEGAAPVPATPPAPDGTAPAPPVESPAPPVETPATPPAEPAPPVSPQ